MKPVPMVLTVLVVAGLLVSPGAGADQQSCPTVCDQIPDTAWIAPGDIPLATTARWPALATVAVPETGAPSPLHFEELCARPAPAGDPRGYAVAATARVARPEGQWQLQAQVLHWRGETWRGGQLATQVFNAAVAALRGCQQGAPDQSPSLTVAEPSRAAAVIAGPVLAHSYLVVHPQSSTLSTLTLWSSAPQVPWPPIDDATVLDALLRPLCAAYLGSCG